jgi:L-ribulose-5-phosphate 3-epimerase
MPMRRREFLAAGALAAAGEGAAAEPAGAVAAGPIPLPPRPDQGLLFSCKYGMTKGETLESRLAAAREAGLDGVDFDDAAAVTPEQIRDAVQATGVFVHNAINHSHWKQTLTSPDPATRAAGLANLEHCIRIAHAAGGSGVLLVLGKAADGPEGPDRAREEIRKALPLAASWTTSTALKARGWGPISTSATMRSTVTSPPGSVNWGRES